MEPTVKFSDRHPSTQQICKYFEYSHLPPHLQAVSEPICALIDTLLARCPDSAETTAGLRKLLEAKDCFVRAAIK